jgi:aryl-alcohol dehydrogenase-like predicted oxidoreductase
MKNKISIGTAQFGMNYGITNKNKSLSISEIGKILSYAKKNKINKIDTAYSYGRAEKKLGNFNLKNWKISTKIPKAPNITSLNYWIKKKINISLIRLKIKKFDTIFIHDIDEIKNKKKFKKIYLSLLELKAQKITKYIGCSIYEVDDLKKLSKYKFDVIQAPANIFNDEIFKKKYSIYFKKKGIKLEIRSIFLQGLLLARPSKLPNRFKNWKKLFFELHNFHKKKKISKISIAFSILRGKNYRSVVIGMSSFSDFKEILINIRKKKIKKLPNFNINNRDYLTNPKKWKL